MQRISLDRPINSPREDRLNRTQFVRQLASRLIHRRKATGLIVGLTGPWGCGKTSILNLLEKELGARKRYATPLVIRFNPWLVSNRDDLIGHFFIELTRSLRDRIGYYDVYGDGADQRKDAAVDVISDYGASISPLMSVLAPRFGHAVNFIRQIAGRKKAANTSIHLQREKVRKALQQFDFPIIVLIDELDRLEDTEVRSMAQLLRSVGDFESISYVAAYDETRVVQALSHGDSPESQDRGQSYLEKIIQIRVSTPSIPNSKIEQILREDLEEIFSLSQVRLSRFQYSRLNRLITICVPELISTTRDIKKISSDYSGRLIGKDNQVDLIDLLALTILANREPKVFDDLLKRQADRNVDITFPNLRSAHAYIQNQTLPQHNLRKWKPENLSVATSRILTFLLPHIRDGFFQRDDLDSRRLMFSNALATAFDQSLEIKKDPELYTRRGKNRVVTKLRQSLQRQVPFDEIDSLDECAKYLTTNDLKAIYSAIVEASRNKNRRENAIMSLDIIQMCSFFMRYRDRFTEHRNFVRELFEDSLTDKGNIFGYALLLNDDFISIMRKSIPGFYWDRPERNMEVANIDRIISEISENVFELDFALSAFIEKDPFGDFRRDIVENSMSRSRFSTDLVDLLFRSDVWGVGNFPSGFRSLIDKTTLSELIENYTSFKTESDLAGERQTLENANLFLKSL